MNEQPVNGNPNPQRHQRDAQLKVFLDALFPDVSGAFIEVRFIKEGLVKQRFFNNVSALVEASAKLSSAEAQQGYHVYFGVCPRIKQEGTKQSVKEVRCLWADLDAKQFKGGKREALKTLQEFVLSPTIIVDSGNGYHAYWVLKEPEPINDPSDVARIEAHNRGLAAALGGDLNACDLARVLRLPGSWNVKDPTRPLCAQIIDCNPARQYNLSEFDWLPQPKAKRKPAYEELKQGPLQQGQRNATLLSFAGLLRHNGFSQTLIEPVMQAVNSSFCQPPLPSEELQGICRSVGGYPAGTAGKVPSAVIEFAPVDLSEVPEPGERVDLVAGLIPKGYPTVLYGDGGQGKSYIALAIAGSVQRGEPFLGVNVQRTGVLYLDWELEQDEMSRRAYRIARGVGMEHPPQGLKYVRAERPFPELVERVKEYVNAHGVGLVILDSLGPACGGDPEQAKFVIPLLNELRGLGTTVLVIDHQSKLQQGQNYEHKTPFGSVYKYNLARSVIQAQRVESKPGELKLILRQTKCNFGPLMEPVPVSMRFEGNAVRLAYVNAETDPAFYEHLTAEDKILKSLEEDGPATRKLMASRTGMNEGTTGNMLRRLKEAGKVQEVNKEGNAPVYDLARPDADEEAKEPTEAPFILTEDTDLGY